MSYTVYKASMHTSNRNVSNVSEMKKRLQIKVCGTTTHADYGPVCVRLHFWGAILLSECHHNIFLGRLLSVARHH